MLYIECIMRDNIIITKKIRYKIVTDINIIWFIVSIHCYFIFYIVSLLKFILLKQINN